MSNRQHVILPHSSVVDRVPAADNAVPGELFINGASGDGVSFMATKKMDDSFAIFHEDEYWNERLSGMVIDDLESEISDKALSAKQGKELNDRLEALENAPSNSDYVKKETLKFYMKLGQTNSDLKPYADSLRESMLGMEDFAKLGSGLFIHWGVYSVPAGTYTGPKQEGSKVTATKMTRNCEWIMRDLAIPIETYKAFASDFNTTNWDPEAIAQMAEDAGMGYVIITAKHHEGFSLYPTNYGYWDVREAGTDDAECSLTILEDLKAACEAHGLKFGIYMSQYADWCAEGGFNLTTNGNWNGSTADLYTESEHMIYLNRTVDQMNEIVEKYNPYIIWWDPVGAYATKYQDVMVNAWMNDYPHIITNDRLVYARTYGDYGTGERTICLRGTKYGEACFTMNNTWGYSDNNETDSWYYSHEKVFKEFFLYSLMYGQNCLMNIGPKHDGTVPDRQIALLTTMKNFVNAYGKFKNYKRVCTSALPKWGYMVELDGNKLLCYVVTKNNPANQNIIIDCVDTTGLVSVDILTPGTNANYTIANGKIYVNNLALDSTTKVGVVRLNYRTSPIILDANRLMGNSKLPARTFVYDNSGVSYDFNNMTYKFAPSRNTTLGTEIIWDDDTNQYTCELDITSDALDTSTYTVTITDTETSSAQTITYNGVLTSETLVNLTNGRRYDISFKCAGTSTSQGTILSGLTFIPYVQIIHPTGVTLDYNTTVVEIDGTAQLTATVLPDDSTNKSVTWSSDDTSIATVEDGLIVGHAAGETTVRVTTVDGNKTDACVVTVTSSGGDIVPVDSISITPNPVTLQVNSSTTLTVITLPVNATYTNVTWESNDETKVTVVDGVITAVGVGSALITAKNVYDNTKMATCVVTVEGVPVESVTLDKTSANLIPGYSETLTCTITPANATNQNIVWTTSDPLKATVENGVIFAKQAGTVTITITSEDGNKTATCDVTIAPESYDYLFERLSMDGSTGQGEIATFQDEDSANYGENIILFSDELTGWTLFGYAQDCINKYQNGSTTTVETNQTLYQCVVDASPWSGVRVDGNNAVSKAIGTHIPLRFRFMAGSDNYVNATTGELMGSSVQESATAPKHPLCLTRNGSTYKFTSDGVTWTEFTGLNSAQLARIKAAILTVGFDYKRSGGAITTQEYRHLYTESPCCVAFKTVVEYPFYTLYHKYDSTIHVACADIVIDTSDITLGPGETRQLTPTLSPAHCTSVIIYSSSDETNATVTSNGLISYVSTGNAVITITCDEVVKTINVICAAQETTYDITKNLSGITLSNDATEVVANGQYTATLSVTDTASTVVGTVTITMGDIDITETAYNSETHTILIDSVTDELVITASANEKITITFNLDDNIKIDGTSFSNGSTLDVTSEEKINWLNSILS